MLHPVYAADFTFDYDVRYQVLETGITKVLQNITLTNENTQYYAQNFSLTIMSSRISNIAANDPGGSISPQVTTDEGQTKILIPFNSKAIGIGKQLNFNLSYDSLDIAEKKGQIWEILIPGIENKPEINSYTVHLSVPTSFGKAAYFSPSPNSAGNWTLKELANHGITAAYGQVQKFTFNLTYHLTNTGFKSQIQEITLPPDTAFQKVVLSRLSQIPQNVYVDADGNWLARYEVKPKENLNIIAEGTVFVYINPWSDSPHALTPEQTAVYTRSQPYWEVTSAMQSKAKELNSPKAIYDYVVSTLHYNHARVEPGITRLGAEAAFTNPTDAVCMEFSDLFVALSRSAGFASREIHGYAYTTNPRLQPLSLKTDILHAWVEYYDTQRHLWAPIDPTWGNTTLGVDYFTKLDFNHIAFAILGTKSDYPHPAGSFKNEANSKDVFVDFAKNTAKISDPQFSLLFNISKNNIFGQQIPGLAVIKNTGSVLYIPKSLKIDIDNSIKSVETTLSPIPPYGKIEIPFTFSQRFQFLPRTITLTATLDGKTIKSETHMAPFYLAFPLIYPLVGTIFLIFVILRRHGKNRLTRQN